MRYLGATRHAHRALGAGEPLFTKEECDARVDAAVAKERAYGSRDAIGSFTFGVLGATLTALLVAKLQQMRAWP